MRQLILLLMLGLLSQSSFSQGAAATISNGDNGLSLFDRSGTTPQTLWVTTPGRVSEYRVANQSSYNSFLAAMRQIATYKSQSSNLNIYQSTNKVPDEVGRFEVSIAHSSRITRVVAVPAADNPVRQISFRAPSTITVDRELSGNPDGWAGSVRLPAGKWNISTYVGTIRIGTVEGVDVGPRVIGNWRRVYYSYSVVDEPNGPASQILDFSDAFEPGYTRYANLAYVPRSGSSNISVDPVTMHSEYSNYGSGQIRIRWGSVTYSYNISGTGTSNRNRGYFGDAIDVYTNPNSQIDENGEYDISLTGWRNLDRIVAVPINSSWGSSILFPGGDPSINLIQEQKTWNVGVNAFNGESGDKALYGKLKAGRYQIRGYLGDRLVLQTSNAIQVGVHIDHFSVSTSQVSWEFSGQTRGIYQLTGRIYRGTHTVYWEQNMLNGTRWNRTRSSNARFSEDQLNQQWILTYSLNLPNQGGVKYITKILRTAR